MTSLYAVLILLTTGQILLIGLLVWISITKLSPNIFKRLVYQVVISQIKTHRIKEE